ncbi:Ras-related protein Rab-12 [Cricetulus griseus]|uniref:small monomeric GTPase n=1 Tax=Cricetulus griseus TaxID=10029 RepID=G3HIU9_CRIGR|nr:Ras-related protein Rab-12 [Cricetulus griseus]ERE84389.1 ras-related protein Rab-12-like protein [Cricetulus griseus]
MAFPRAAQIGEFGRDTAGQERFNSITSAYYRSAKGIILVYDITKKETFDDLPKWMKMIDKYASEDAELLLVGNKLDCEADREISKQQGEKFAQQITGMRFCEASAKDNFNVDEIFLKLVDDILKKAFKDLNRAMPMSSEHCKTRDEVQDQVTALCTRPFPDRSTIPLRSR